MIRNLVEGGKLAECLEYIHTVFISELETAMCDVSEALIASEEHYCLEASKEWLKTQQPSAVDFELRCKDYIIHVFPSASSPEAIIAWPHANKIRRWTEMCAGQRKMCDTMRDELGHLIAHFGVVGGDNEVIKSSKLLQDNLSDLAECLESLLVESPYVWRSKMNDAVLSLKGLCSAVLNFQDSLYHQKHGFYFRKVKQWLDILSNGLLKVEGLSPCVRPVRLLDYLYYELFPELEMVLLASSMSHTTNEQPKCMTEKSAKVDVGCVAEELKIFEKQSLPKFLVDQMERDTTRFVNLTTIATFFSSVTATTLQFTYTQLQSEASESLRGVVNLFWFLSLVFSVSSGVGSLLGLTWRKSSIYDSRVPPKLIGLWFDKAPMLFLVIAAIAFVIGLNLFAYLSLQPSYVSLTTNIFTGVHGSCLLTVTSWFIYQLKFDTPWAQWIRKVVGWVVELRKRKWIIEVLQWIRHPRQQYRKYKSHLQRNMFWAFGMDNHVARINYRIDWASKWPEPYLLSRLIRCITYPIKKYLLATLSVLGYPFRRCTCFSFRTKRSAEVKLEKTDWLGANLEELEAQEETPLDEKAKKDFCRALQNVFSDADHVQTIMKYIERREENVERYMANVLWGYPSLVNKFLEDVQPAFAAAHGKRNNEKGKGDMVVRTAELIDNHDPQLPTSGRMDKDKNDAEPTSYILPSNQPDSLGDGAGPSFATHNEFQPDSILIPAEKLTHPPTECPPSAVAHGKSKTPEHTTGNTIPGPHSDGPHMADGATTQREIDDISLAGMEITIEESRMLTPTEGD